MKPLDKQQLITMLELQNTLNRMINPEWLTANYPFGRAIRIECAELSDHLGWKWWKDQQPNMGQAQIEVVDIWHFMLSLALVEARGTIKTAADTIEAGLQFSTMEVIQVLNKSFTFGGLTLQESVDIMSMFGSLGYCVPPLFQNLMVGTGLDWEQVYVQYVGKNVLNIFRQQHGYKDGSYVKTWHGEEDNVHLERILAFRPNIKPDDLLSALTSIYDTVPKTWAASDGGATAA